METNDKKELEKLIKYIENYAHNQYGMIKAFQEENEIFYFSNAVLSNLIRRKKIKIILDD